jgi:Tol biopolymer transport system component
MDATGSNQVRLTQAGADDQDPCWSPDGTRIAFESDRDGNYEIYVMDADGSHQTRLTHDPALDSTPTWSTDGTRIAFSRDSCWQVSLEECPGKSEIYLMRDRGGGEVRLTNNRFEDDMPDWFAAPE